MALTYNVPLSYTINVSLSALPQGLAEFNTNSIAIFTNEPAGFSESYQAYLSPTAVGTDFGTDSLTYKMANALFAPVPNFRSGGGYLYIFPFNGVNASSGSFTTPDITDNLTSFQSANDAGMSITIDGETQIVTGLNFSSVKSVADIVTVLKNKNLDVDIEANEGTIVFTSRRTGASSAITINETDGFDGIDIYGASYLNVPAGNATTGTNASGQTLADAVAEGLQQVYFGGVLTTQYTDDDTTLANAQAIQSLDCVFYNDMKSMKDIADLGADIKAAGLGKTRTLAYTGDSKAAIATYSSIASSINFSGSKTMITMNLKTLTGLIGDGGLSDTYLLNAQSNGVDVYGNTGGISVVYSNDNNGYTDDIKGQLWLKKAIEVAGFNYLRQTNTKIPQTEEGMTGLRNAYAQVCEQGVRNGFVAPGTWNGSISFGDPEKFAEAIEQKGYYIYSIPVAQQSQTDREARKAPVVQIAIKCAGAFHFSYVTITIQR